MTNEHPVVRVARVGFNRGRTPHERTNLVSPPMLQSARKTRGDPRVNYLPESGRPSDSIGTLDEKEGELKRWQLLI